MRALRVLALFGAVAWLGGCAAVAVSAGSMLADAGVSHTLSGISYKTFTAPMANTRLAALKTLSRMDMTVTREGRTKRGWGIEATATDRTIEISLERLTDNATRMRVTADEGSFFSRDSATANEIIVQTAQVLERDAMRMAKAEE